MDGLDEREAEWTVRDRDGVVHRATRHVAHVAHVTHVVTACSWWHTHNIVAELEPVRVDHAPTCLECTMIELGKLTA